MKKPVILVIVVIICLAVLTPSETAGAGLIVKLSLNYLVQGGLIGGFLDGIMTPISLAGELLGRVVTIHQPITDPPYDWGFVIGVIVLLRFIF